MRTLGLHIILVMIDLLILVSARKCLREADDIGICADTYRGFCGGEIHVDQMPLVSAIGN